MLVLLLFNMGGYMLLFQYFINRSDTIVFNQINNNHYKQSDLVEVRVPVNFKTVENEDAYTPVSGQVRVKDTTYNFAYLKMTTDTMYLLCIPNHEKGRLENAKIVYAKQVSDGPVNERSRIPLFKKSVFESDFNYTAPKDYALVSVELTKILPDYSFLNIIKASVGIPGQPPDRSNTLS